VASFGAVSDLAETDHSGLAGFKIGEGFLESAVFQAGGVYVLCSPDCRS